MFEQISSYFSSIPDQFWLLLPVGIIGLWRWSIWLLRKGIGQFYRPQLPETYRMTVSIVTPVYNEEPELFLNALKSWASEGPDEIIAVIDHSDTACAHVFNEFAKTFSGARRIITEKSGKRPALADGIMAANNDIVILIDSDTLWEAGVLAKIMTPFKNPKVGGVGTRQNVLAPKTLSQRLFDIHLDSRYLEEIRFLAASGDALTCLSGRTAAYRRAAVLPLLNDLINETFFGKPCISGDDKRLTHLVQAEGWQVKYQESARVFTPGAPKMRSFLKQRLRWTRNSWRADLRAMYDGWVWKKPALAFHLVDRVFQPFATLIAPCYFLISLYYQRWWVVLVLLLWWFISRAIKIMPHLQRRPSSIGMLPLYIGSTFLLAIFKIFALFTMNQQGWLTRWDTSRLASIGKLRLIPAYGSTLSVVFLIGLGTLRLDELQQQFLLNNVAERVYTVEADLPNYDPIAASDQAATVTYRPRHSGAIDVAMGQTPYVLQNGDTEARLSRRYGVNTNSISTENWTSGQVIQLQMPFSDSDAFRQGLIHNLASRSSAQLKYHADDNTIVISGWDSVVDVPTLHKTLANEDLLAYEGDGVYLLKANLHLAKHTALLIEAPAVTWLKLKSDVDGYINITSSGSSIYIDDTKITSWNPSMNGFDYDYQDGRSYIKVTNSRMDIIDSDIGYLGFPISVSGRGGVYGLSWRITDISQFGKQLTTGQVVNSRIHHNYFGIYTFGATGMVFKSNEIFENVQYGLDPHDDSNNFIVEHNYVHHNGNHGIIFSKRCFNNIIRWNRSENNRLHGVMLDRQSNGNSVYENTLIGNTDGVALWDSHRNAVFKNTIVGNKRGVRLNQGASQNTISDNKVIDNHQYGLYFYDQAHQNPAWRNEITGSLAGVYLRSQQNVIFDNLIKDNENGIFLTDEASRNLIQDNRLANNLTGIYLKTDADEFLFDNGFQTNEHNIRISEAWLRN